MKQNSYKNRLKKLIAIISITSILSIMAIPKQVLAATYTQTVKTGIDSFPVEYREILENLQNSYPNATFQAYYTGISWDDLIKNETSVHTRNMVINSADSSWKCDCGVSKSGYTCASEEIIEYFIDPRNFLNEVNIFQFLEISYNENVHTLEGIENAVQNTFLDNDVTFYRYGQTKTMSYSEIILEAAKQSNMSPYSIITKIIQEVGSKGSSSVSGTYSGYEGYYNFYNFGAYDSGNAIVNALVYAQQNGWDNQYDAIVEGAELLSDSYTNAGQNTAYFYKWDVVGRSILKSGQTQTVSTSDMFSHQYMANIQDPTNQSKRLYNTYAKNNLLDKKLNFIIPIYEEEGSTNKLPSNIDTTSSNAYYVNDSDGINVRQEPSTSATRITSISKDTVVTMIQKSYTVADGYTWDKIQLSNGIVGYAVDDYLSPCNESTSQKEESKTVSKAVTTDNLRLRQEPSTAGVKIATIPEGTEIEVLEKDVANDGTNIWYKVAYNGTEGYVSSLYLELLDSSTSSSSLTKGDVNGDNKVNSADALKILKYCVGTENLSQDETKAADVNGDGKINSADALKILKYCVGTDTL